MRSLAVPVWTAVFLLFAANMKQEQADVIPASVMKLPAEGSLHAAGVCRSAGFQAQSDELFIKAQPLCFGWRSKQILLDYHTEHQPCSGPAVSVTLISSKHLTMSWPQYLCELTVGVAALVYRCPQESDDWLRCCCSNKMALYKNPSVIKHKYLSF